MGRTQRNPREGGRPKRRSDLAEVVKEFAEELEADLLFRGIDVLDWHRGLISDRRLIILIRHLPDDSATKKAMRDGDWGLTEHLAAGVWNEVKALRADLTHAQYRPVLPPSAAAAEEKRIAASRAGHDALMAVLRGEGGVADG